MKIDVENILKELNLNEKISYDEIPNLDLYMDQVITLFENTLPNSKRSSEDKILTKTMINNYSKDKLLMPAVNKKYTKDHIILMILIYALKQSLSISDIKILLNNVIINKKTEDNIDLKSLYNLFLSTKENTVAQCEKDITKNISSLEESVDSIFLNENDYIKKLISVLYLIETANAYKRTAEKIIDSM
ncbi:MAG: DUF1836 domain-containing protein [Clostridiaceae bacterium]